ncbi:Ferric enterobactin transport system permease protein fepG [Actinomyces viscosus]|uniref:Ferric enterobactin transport system permease protein fepG n=1 Tax=Actinomyces viscosus TaxID=1656 RepID=A0A448PL16_ACTVI|nr:Ferric enterobactin transport system permease protein fepG [Actinomyces viscosus]
MKDPMSRPPSNQRLQDVVEPQERPEGPERSERPAYLGPPISVRRLPVGPRQELLLHRRAVTVTIILVLAALAVMVLTVLTGTYNISAADALGTLLRGTGSDLDRFIVIDQRLPRALAAVLVGAMLALSGAIFQSLSRNPLGSPDIVGFTTGASTGGLLAILLVSASSTYQIGAGTIIGGLATAGIVALVTLRRGVGGDNLILAGIALSEMLSAANSYLISRASLQSAEAAKAWQYGSFNAISWGQVRPLLMAAIVLLPQVVWFVRPAAMLEMGDDAATSLGMRVGRIRGAMLGYGVVLAAVCVAVAGPIGFLALAAPQLARRLSRSVGITMVASAAMGALLLGGADFLAQRLLSPFQIPVGLISAALGGIYLIWLLMFPTDRAGQAG